MQNRIVWGSPFDKKYEIGIDRGVLYFPEGGGVAWNGLISVEENSNVMDPTPVYHDGVRTNNISKPREYSGVLTAYTYPDEFMLYDGYETNGRGVYAGAQMPKQFGLSYRTLLDDGKNYKIHLLYNLTATPSSVVNTTIGSEMTPTQFVWKLVGVPEEIPGFRPAAHIVLDTREMDAVDIPIVEGILYGSTTRAPRLLSALDAMAI